MTADMKHEKHKDALKYRPKVVSVRILVAGYESKVGFNVPKKVAALLGVKSGKKKVWISITNVNGVTLYCGPARLKSGPEVYGTLEDTTIADAIDGEKRLWIDISMQK